METTSSKIWIRVTVSISYNDSRYTMIPCIYVCLYLPTPPQVYGATQAKLLSGV